MLIRDTVRSSESSDMTRELMRLLQTAQVSWFPSHMRKSVAALRSTLNYVHCVVEVRDGRIPFSSANPMLDFLLGKKKRIVVFNKRDLCPPKNMKRVAEFFESHHEPCMALNAKHASTQDVNRLIRLMSTSVKRRTSTVPSVIAVVGYPNVGKSTLINSIRNITMRRGCSSF